MKVGIVSHDDTSGFSPGNKNFFVQGPRHAYLSDVNDVEASGTQVIGGGSRKSLIQQ